MAKETAVEVQIEGRTLKLTNLAKVLYPEVGFTKGQVIDYYTRIAPVLLPHTHDHPLTLKRFPNGVDGEFFYEKNCPKHRPPWVQTATVWSGGNNRDMYYCLCHVAFVRGQAARAAHAGVRPRSRTACEHRRLLPDRADVA